MEFSFQYIILKTIINQLFVVYPIDIICYIMKILMTPPTIDIFCRQKHTFVIKDFFGHKNIHYHGTNNYRGVVSIELNLFANKFNAGHFDVSIILPCQQKVIYFDAFGSDNVRDIFSNLQQIQSHEYLKNTHQIVCSLPEKIIETCHGKDRLYLLSETRKTIYGLRLYSECSDDYPRFELCYEKNDIRLFRYIFSEEIKKIICNDAALYILTLKGDLYCWVDYNPLTQTKISIQSYVDFYVGSQFPPICLTSDGSVYIINTIDEICDIDDLIKLDINEPVKEIHYADFYTYILTESGKLYSCDVLNFGLEINETVTITCDKVYHSWNHYFIADKKGKIYRIGDNNYG